MAQKIYLKTILKDTAESLSQYKKVLPNGIIAYESDTNKMKLCDGVHTYSDLPYAGGECAGQDSLEKEIKELKAEIKALKSSIPVEPITPAEVSSALKTSGKVQLVTDTTIPPLATGIMAKNETTINLNGNKLTFATNGDNSPMIVKGSSHYTFVGNGVVAQEGTGALVHVASQSAIVDVYNGSFEANGVECLYCQNGTINVYGGVFKVANEDKRYLLNCLDASYKAGTAKINVFGGKFYDFDPSNNASEGKGTNYVVEGYKVVTEQDGEHTVYSVVKA